MRLSKSVNVSVMFAPFAGFKKLYPPTEKKQQQSVAFAEMVGILTPCWQSASETRERKMAQFKLGPMQRKWLAALKSGKYNHGTGRLCNITEEGLLVHCCLGVLCEVMGQRVNWVSGETHPPKDVVIAAGLLVCGTDLALMSLCSCPDDGDDPDCEAPRCVKRRSVEEYERQCGETSEETCARHNRF